MPWHDLVEQISASTRVIAQSTRLPVIQKRLGLLVPIEAETGMKLTPFAVSRVCKP